MTVSETRAPSRTAGIALAVVVVGLLGWLVLASPLFRVAEIEVAGNRRLDDEAIRALSGAADGESMILVSTDEIESAVETSPWIRDASVTRSFPSTLVVHVRERVPVARGTDLDGAFLVADDGVVLARATDPALPGVGRYPRVLAPGDVLPGVSLTLRALVSLDPSVRRQVESARSHGEALTLVLRGGGEIRYGAPEELVRKGAAAEAVLEWAMGERVRFRYIDVSSPESPVLRPVGRGRGELEPTIDATP